ncbi:gliding motility-associated C-terminal domain-containing protein [Maribacter dokdonensis]|uniref:Gliding motility-associated C-terminal domain-containing protein n=1 Tax=Maribacter dokdonensis TaxID=320912 RepID=A0A1H4LZY4_9FLAO|nr:gliding motility-associated C-terminal domain-containing protein [Maribacter dokdonensis]SEB76236.1 gliding motility-associated C-terminal domain-containing protein [Maribacter dokdonensis]
MKHKNFTYPFILLFLVTAMQLQGQKMRNHGDFEVHTNGQVGFFGPIINDGFFFSNSGLVGLYGESSYHISGNVVPKLYDLEIANASSILLNVPVTISNNVNFILGDLETTKTDSINYLEFSQLSFSTGSSDFSKMNGFVKANVQEHFMFPTGDNIFLRPISVESTLLNVKHMACYLFEDSTKNYPFYSNEEIAQINTNEFWILKGAHQVSITIDWNERSSIERITDDINDIEIVGYHISTSQWKSLGGRGNTGDLNSGFLSSEPFIPNDYAAITFGIFNQNENEQPEIPLNSYHYMLSPNGDGINDKFIIEELADYENNVLHIYDRNGLLVFEAQNYTDEFDGNTGKTISALDRDAGLAQGIYYYIAAVNGGEFSIQGYLYIDR